LTKQAQAQKTKKSLNIIHIGNICMRPSNRRFFSFPTSCRVLSPRMLHVVAAIATRDEREKEVS
jgi:hypothetical protein